MRWLLRSFLFSCISLPLFYLLALPWLMGKLNVKTRAESYAQCQHQLHETGMAGSPTALLKAPQADAYCHCVSDSITLTRADLVPLAQHQPPTRLTAAMKPTVDACNDALKAGINQTITTAPAPSVTRDANGVEIVHFN